MKNWILVVARDGARIFEQGKRGSPLTLISEFAHPEGRKKNGELTSDRQGRSMETGADAHHAFSSQQEPKERLLLEFVNSLSTYIEKDLHRKSFDRLTLIAGPHTMGVLKKNLDKQLLKKVDCTITKDLYHCEEPELREQIERA